MKGERTRYQQTGKFHSLTFSCFRRRPCFTSAEAKDLFEDVLERVRLRYLFVVAGFRRSRQKPFWQAHYYDFNVYTHDKFVEKLRYILRNPVRRGLVAELEKCQWSSFRHYATGVRGTVEIESEWTAQQRGWQLPQWMLKQRADSAPSPVPKSEGPGAPSAGYLSS